jgi:ubiquinone/menaquinone biosynthesis C-methylase UbiE
MTTFTYQESDVHRRYDLGRALTSEATDALMELLRDYVTCPVNLIVDLGSGTGRFTTALSEAFAAQVLGVEPAANMRATAEAKPHPARVRFVQGQAESIPLVDVWWTSCSCLKYCTTLWMFRQLSERSAGF